MKKKLMLWAAVSVIVMLALPWAAVTFIKGDGAMAACFALFYAVNPVYSILSGRFAGKHMKYLWVLPVLSGVLFLLGVWLFFSMGEPAFFTYAAGYILLGVCAMLISAFIGKKRAENA